MSRFNAKDRAEAIAASTPGAGPDFLPRAAACCLMQAAGAVPFLRFEPLSVWPGRITDYPNGLSRAELLSLGEAIVALAKDAA